MENSLLSKSKQCYICGSRQNIHLHHIYQNANRKNSEKIGAWCYLCANHHTLDRNSVHQNPKMAMQLKIKAQEEYEKEHTREEFMKIIHRNYLD